MTCPIDEATAPRREEADGESVLERWSGREAGERLPALLTDDDPAVRARALLWCELAVEDADGEAQSCSGHDEAATWSWEFAAALRPVATLLHGDAARQALLGIGFIGNEDDWRVLRGIAHGEEHAIFR